MKKYFLLLVFLSAVKIISAQAQPQYGHADGKSGKDMPPPPDTTHPKVVAPKDTAYLGDSSTVFDYVEEMPNFTGGYDSLMKYIWKHFDYSTIDGDQVVGVVYLSFVVEKDGHLSNVMIKKSCGNANMDKRVKTFFEVMPPWTPGKMNGSTVRTRIIEPFRIELR
ncbi:MAG TPA: energy transducer TonB [Bacteroidia bacterium]|jgi:TonB family protein|nr:energy transducer TonB [Bacteroidia bacterium]